MQRSNMFERFSLFRNRGPKGFDLATRYYDAEKERLEERRQRLGRTLDATLTDEERRSLLASRIQHSWQRRSGDGTRVLRLVMVLILVLAGLYIIMRKYGLLAA